MEREGTANPRMTHPERGLLRERILAGEIPGSVRGRRNLSTRGCTMCHSTHVIPFNVHFEPGRSLFEQTVYAAKKAMVAGQLRPGDPFPSVRSLSRDLKINPNTAHKVVTHLIAEGLLETRPGIGTVVSEMPHSSRKERTAVLGRDVEALVVGAKRLSIELEDVLESITTHWQRLTPESSPEPSDRSPQDGDRKRR